MDFKIIKAILFSSVNTNDFVRYGNTLYKLIDKRVLLSIGIRNLKYSVEINFSIVPIFLFNGTPLFSFFFPGNLKSDLLGCNGAFWHWNKEGNLLDDKLMELLVFDSISEEKNEKVLGFTKTVFCEAFEMLRGIRSTEDCVSILLRCFPYDDGYWTVDPGIAASVCDLLIYLKEFDLCRKCIDGYCRHWNSNPVCIECNAKFEPFIEVFTAALDSGDFTFLHDKFLEFSRNNVRHLEGTAFAFSEEDFAEFERSIEWMKGNDTAGGEA